MPKKIAGLEFSSFKLLWLILLFCIHLSCAHLTKAPTGYPNLPEERFFHYLLNDKEESYIMLPKKSKDELKAMLEGVLKQLDYRVGIKDFEDEERFKMSTGFHLQGEDPLIQNLVVSIALVFDVYMQGEPKLEIRYGVAWSRKKESTWKYDNFDFNLQQFIEDYLKKLDQKIAGIKRDEAKLPN